MTTKSFKRTTLIAVSAYAVAYIITAASPIWASTPSRSEVQAGIVGQAQQGLAAGFSQNSSNVTNTGDNVNTSSNSNTSSTTGVTNQNSATINQTANSSANTGDNEASRNIAIGGNAGMITTGNATTNTVGVVNANTNATAVSGSQGGAANSSDITNTGNNATTSSNSSSTAKTYVVNGNAVTINQTANSTANTGNNKADRNISIGGQAGVITTGAANSNTDFLIAANGSVALIGGNSNGNGPGSGASIVLLNTGGNGHFNTEADTLRSTLANNHNTAAINQSCGGAMDQMLGFSGCSANTGGNSADRGIARGGSAGVINTADATVNVTMVAAANKNATQINGGAGTGAGTKTDVLNTGDNTGVSTSANSSNTTGVGNSNAGAVNQTVNAIADTGHNHANRNIAIGGDAGVIHTGNATVNTVMVADVNSNNTQVSAPLAPAAAESSNGLGIVNTGNNSTFNAQAHTNTVTEIQNNNLLEAFQAVLGWVNTGFNGASANIGGGPGITTSPATATSVFGVAGNSNTSTLH